MKIFEKYNFNIKGNILSKSEFKLLPFCQKEALVEDKVKELLLAAEEDLKRKIPSLTLSKYRAYNVSGSTSEYGSPYRMRCSLWAEIVAAPCLQALAVASLPLCLWVGRGQCTAS